MRLTILTEGDKKLRKKSVPVNQPFTSELQDFIKDMIETMYQADGVGLAAPQVGHNLRLFVVASKKGPLVMINPALSKKSLRKQIEEEGCLSVPGVYGLVKRHRSVTVTYLDKRGEKQVQRAEGFFSRVIQHETDHLDGILFIERAHKITKAGGKPVTNL